MEVWRIDKADISEVLAMQMLHFKEKGHLPNGLSFDSSFCYQNLVNAFDTESELFLGLYTDSRELVGYIWLGVIQPHYTREYYAAERYLYIMPSYRNGRGLKLLIDTSISLSKDIGASYLQLGNFSHNASLEKAYRKRFSLLGTNYCIELKEK